MRRLSVFLLAFVFVSITPLRAQDEIKLISPYSAALSSAVVPGWGQLRTGHPVQGVVTAALLGGALASALLVRSSYLDIYNNEYVPAALVDPKSPIAQDAFGRANQRYKTSQFFFFTALGVWAYAVVDSYVGAHIYNAERKANQLKENEPHLEVLLNRESLNAQMAFQF